MFRKLGVAALAAGLALPGSAAEVPPKLVAKLLKVIVTTAEGGNGAIECHDFEVKRELLALGVNVEDHGLVAWVTDPQSALKASVAHKLGVGSSLVLLDQGAALVIVNEGGRPTLYMSALLKDNAKVKPSDAVAKISKVMK